MKQQKKVLLLWCMGMITSLASWAQPNITKVEYYIDTDPGYGNATNVGITPAVDLSGQSVNINPATLSEGVHIFGIRAQDADGQWSLDNKFLFVKPFSNAPATPNVVYVEYYIDQDPGYGLATSVAVTPGADLPAQLINLNPASIAPGVHIFGIRARDAYGAWSLENKYLFYKQFPDESTPPPVPNIIYVEYFIDSDPGWGNATSVAITPGTDLSGQLININPTTIAPGVHIMGLRAKDANNKWSLDNKWLFVKLFPEDVAPPPVPDVTYVEYYIDSDPGRGNGTMVAITPGTDLANVAININPTSLAPGSHTLGIRSRDAYGNWSIDNRFVFDYPFAAGGPVPDVQYVEYYIDNDPGHGNGIVVPVTPGQDIANVSFDIDTTGLGLNIGMHDLVLRALDANGHWSFETRFEFEIPNNACVIEATASNNAPCPGSDLMLSGNYTGSIAGIASWSWTGPGGYSSNQQNPVIALASSSNNGNYILTVTDSNGCVDIDTTNVSILPITATQASNLTITAVTEKSMNVAFTRGTGSKGVIVLVKEDAPITTPPQCGQTYMAPTAASTVYFNADSLFSMIDGAKVLYRNFDASPTTKSFNLKNLKSSRRYYFAVYEYDSSGIGTVYLTNPSLTSDTPTIIVAPKGKATNGQFEDIMANSLKLKWKNGDGVRRIVLAKAVDKVNGIPTDTMVYNANSIFGHGAQIGIGNYVVYDGTDSSVTVTNLLAGTKYNFTILEYNGYGTWWDYATSGLKMNTTTLKDFVPIVKPGIPLVETFDSLGLGGQHPAGVLPTGWHIGAPGFTLGNGSSPMGGVYSFGTTGNSDRALGSLFSSSLASKYGVKLMNTSKKDTITSVVLQYFGEQWRTGGVAAPQRDTVYVEYSTNAYMFNDENQYRILPAAETDATWTRVAALKFISPQSAASGAIDGNDPNNRVQIIASITGLSLPLGSQIWIRFVDFDRTSPAGDDGLAIDDVEIIPFSKTIIGSGSITGKSFNDLNIVSGTVTLDTNSVSVKYALNIEAGATLDIEHPSLYRALGIKSWLYGSGNIMSGDRSSITVEGSGIGHDLYFTPGASLSKLTIKTGTTHLRNPVSMASSPKAGLVTVGLLNPVPTPATLNTNGNLTLKSDSVYTATIGVVEGVVNGPVMIERFMQTATGFRLMTHPFSSAMQLNTISDDISGMTAGDAASYNASAGAAAAVNDISTFWSPFANLNNNWNQYQTIRLEKAIGSTTLEMFGSVNQGPVNYNFTNPGSNPFILIGNPYPAGLKVGAALTSSSSNISLNTIWTWNPALGVGGAFVPIPSTKVASTSIPMFGAIVAQLTGVNGSVNFSETNKTTTGNTKFYFREAEEAYVLPEGLQLTIEKDGHYFDGLYVYFDAAANTAGEAVDGPKLVNPDFNFYSLASDGERLSVDNRPFKTGDYVPLSLATQQRGSFTVGVSDWNLPEGTELYLVDLQNGFESMLAADVRYEFSIDNNSLVDRFRLRMGRSILNTTEVFRVELLPNPVEDELTIRVHSSVEAKGTVRIVSATGQQVLQQEIQSTDHGQLRIPVKTLSPGVYLVEVLVNGQKQVKQLLKK